MIVDNDTRAGATRLQETFHPIRDGLSFGFSRLNDTWCKEHDAGLRHKPRLHTARKKTRVRVEGSVLAAEDDPDDRLLLEMAFADMEHPFDLRIVEDGFELMEYLHHQGDYAESMPSRPRLILLDLNMPRIDGREALVQIKKSSLLKEIPVVMWTTSGEEEDRFFCLKAGASAYMTKPSSFPRMKESIRDVIGAHLHFHAREASAVDWRPKCANVRWD